MPDRPPQRRFSLDELQRELASLNDGDELAALAARLTVLRDAITDTGDAATAENDDTGDATTVATATSGEADPIWELVKRGIDEVSPDRR